MKLKSMPSVKSTSEGVRYLPICFTPFKRRSVWERKATWWCSRTDFLETLSLLHNIISRRSFFIAKRYPSSIAGKDRETKWAGTTDSHLDSLREWRHLHPSERDTSPLIPVRAISYQPGCTRNTAQELTPPRLWVALAYFEIKGKCECQISLSSELIPVL